jgi:hypothetical protein
MSIVSSGMARARTALITLALLVPLIFVAQATTGAGRAEASCPGYNNPVTGQLLVGAFLYATETPAPNTCDYDNNYQTTFQSSSSAWRASVIMWDTINNQQIIFPGGYDTNPHSLNVTFYKGGYAPVRIVLCLDNLAYGGGIYCGWGSNWTYHNTQYVVSYANSGDNTYF